MLYDFVLDLCDLIRGFIFLGATWLVSPLLICLYGSIIYYCRYTNLGSLEGALINAAQYGFYIDSSALIGAGNFAEPVWRFIAKGLLSVLEGYFTRLILVNERWIRNSCFLLLPNDFGPITNSLLQEYALEWLNPLQKQLGAIYISRRFHSFLFFSIKRPFHAIIPTIKLRSWGWNIKQHPSRLSVIYHA